MNRLRMVVTFLNDSIDRDKLRNHSEDQVALVQNDNNIKIRYLKVQSTSEHLKCEECGCTFQAKNTKFPCQENAQQVSK